MTPPLPADNRPNADAGHSAGAAASGANSLGLRVEVKLFALVKQLVGQAEVEVELPPGSTVGDLRTALGRQYPVLAPLGNHLSFAVGGDYAGDEAPLVEGAEVACIPPVSGG